MAELFQADLIKIGTYGNPDKNLIAAVARFSIKKLLIIIIDKWKEAVL